MSSLLEESLKDIGTLKSVQKDHDESYLNVCCYHMQQAIEKIMKYSIEIKGSDYPYTHNIDDLYEIYIQVGWDSIDMLDMMADTLTKWESSSRHGGSFRAALAQLERAEGIYKELYTGVIKYLEDYKELNQKTGTLDTF